MSKRRKADDEMEKFRTWGKAGGKKGGKKRGQSKRRGDSDHYRQLGKASAKARRLRREQKELGL